MLEKLIEGVLDPELKLTKELALDGVTPKDLGPYKVLGLVPDGADLGTIEIEAASSVELAKYESEKFPNIGLPESSPVAPVIVKEIFIGSADDGFVKNEKITERQRIKIIFLRDAEFVNFIS